MRIYDKVKIRKHMHLYIITDGEFYKIGIAKNISNRLRNLQTSNARKLSIYRDVIIPEVNARYIEKCMHERFSKYRLNGEWFSKKCITEIDKMSDSEICNINNFTKTDDGIYLYEICKSEYGDFLKKHKLFYNDDGYLEFSDRRHNSYINSLPRIIERLDDTSMPAIYTLDADKVPEYLKIAVNYTKTKLEEKIDRYQSTLDHFKEHLDNIKNRWSDFVEEG